MRLSLSSNKIIMFLKSHPADFCPNLISQEWVTWPVPSVRKTGRLHILTGMLILRQNHSFVGEKEERPGYPVDN